MTITPAQVYSVITVKEGDNARILYDTLTLGGQPVPLTNATVSLWWYDTVEDTRTEKSATIVSDVSGSVSYQLTTDDVSEPGVKLLEWSIQFQNGKTLRLPTEGYIKLNISGDLATFFPGGAVGVGVVTPNNWSDFTFIVKPATTTLVGRDVTGSMQTCGLMSDPSTLLTTHGFYFERSGSDANWFGVVRSASVQARVDTSVPYTSSTRWYNLTATHDRSFVYFYVDGTLRGTLASSASSVPGFASASLGFGYRMAPATASLAYTVSIDLIRLRGNNIDR